MLCRSGRERHCNFNDIWQRRKPNAQHQPHPAGLDVGIDFFLRFELKWPTSPGLWPTSNLQKSNDLNVEVGCWTSECQVVPVERTLRCDSTLPQSSRVFYKLLAGEMSGGGGKARATSTICATRKVSWYRLWRWKCSAKGLGDCNISKIECPFRIVLVLVLCVSATSSCFAFGCIWKWHFKANAPSSTARKERELFEHADKGGFSEAPSILGVQVGMGMRMLRWLPLQGGNPQRNDRLHKVSLCTSEHLWTMMVSRCFK